MDHLRTQRLQAVCMVMSTVFANTGHAAEAMAAGLRGNDVPAAPLLRLEVQKRRTAPANFSLQRKAAVAVVVPGSCEYSQSSLCYNYQSGNAVYKPSRKLMPEINGLQRESVSLKRDKITFRYSFR